MAITDELRKYATAHCHSWLCEKLLAIADSIDTELAERYVELPMDADGEYIRIGDELRDGWHEQNQGEVERLMLDHHGWWLMLKSCPERFYVHEFHEWHHRHHQPTVEDVLQEFADKVQRCCDTADTIAEYAKRLRLAGDAE